MSIPATFHLNVQQIEQVCLFELVWGQGQRLTTTLPFPSLLFSLYAEWQQAYLSFYRTAQIPLSVAPETPQTPLRGRKEESGVVVPPLPYWHGLLVEAEARLLSEFHRWLRSGELYEIRAQLAAASRTVEGAPHPIVNLCLTCTPIALARFPWEAWELETEFAVSRQIRISRTPTTIRSATHSSANARRQRIRILAILGDERGLNLQTDRVAVRSLRRLADVEFIGWKKAQPIEDLKTQISQMIADERGWDVLFFAGHSDETPLTGGELGIAPGVSIRISEIAPQLAIAQSRGLQFAIFNSCNGLAIAESLIDLGLSQVAVMREPIHNRVAEEFLLRFLQRLATHHDVHESLRSACQFLKTEKSLTYPSAYLIPSLFRHPEATLFRIEPCGWQSWWRQWRPKRYEMIALAALIGISWQLPIQQWLLEHQVLGHAYYRQLTDRLTSESLPILLVQVDEESLASARRLQPIPRDYLGRLIQHLTELEAQTIGIDYLLSPPIPEEDPVLARSVAAAHQQGIWFVFGASQDKLTRKWRYAAPEVDHPNWSFPGNIARRGRHYVELLPDSPDDNKPLPLSYRLAWLHQGCVRSSEILPEISSEISSEMTNQPACSLAQFSSEPSPEPLLEPPVEPQPADRSVVRADSSRVYPHWLTQVGYHWGQMWLHPIMDYSFPPEQIYTAISAADLLTSTDATRFSDLSQQTVLIAPNYGPAGVDYQGEDNFLAPAAMHHWYTDRHPGDRYSNSQYGNSASIGWDV
ncbi:MAG: CHASE2 domain-containing protein [Cyanobacteria bacterium CRU_2_1]|nr:CHASE2 domain-containing protein [Cyanobacteria bacterium CRU_2_1]